jgi:hypothetical protein
MLEHLRMGVEEIEMDKVVAPAEGREGLVDHRELENVQVKDLHNLAVEDIGPGVGSLVADN